VKKEAVIPTLKKTLAKNKTVQFAYLFGSFLKRKDARDIDVAVYLKSRKDSWKRAQEIGDVLEKAIDYTWPIDVHALNEAVPAFRFRVLADGKLLLERNKAERLTWEAHAMSQYQDIKPMLDFYDRKFLSR